MNEKMINKEQTTMNYICEDLTHLFRNIPALKFVAVNKISDKIEITINNKQYTVEISMSNIDTILAVTQKIKEVNKLMDDASGIN